MFSYSQPVMPGTNAKKVAQNTPLGFGDGTQDIVGIPTGITDFDNLTSGLNGFTLLAGRSGSGKTSLAAQIAANLSKPVEGLPTQVIFVSYELTYWQAFGIISAQIMDASYKDILLKGNTEEFRDRILETSNQLEHLVIVDARMIENTLEEIAKLVRDTGGKAGKYAHRVVIIDSIQDLVDGVAGKDRTSSESEIAKQVDLMWQELGLDIIAISRTNKGKAGDDYSEVYGSVSLVYKPTDVIVMKSIKNIDLNLADMARKAKLRYYPIRCNVIKTRYGDGEGIFYLGWDVVTRRFLGLDKARMESAFSDKDLSKTDPSLPNHATIFNQIKEALSD